MKTNIGMTDEKFTKMVKHGQHAPALMIMVTVYKNPLDFPNKYVARLWFINKAYYWPSETTYIVRDDLNSIRVAIPNDMVNIGRKENDDPTILETYI